MRKMTIVALSAGLCLIGCSKKADKTEAKPAEATEKPAKDNAPTKPVKEVAAEADKAATPPAPAVAKLECPEGTTAVEDMYCKDAEGKRQGPYLKLSEDGLTVNVKGQYENGEKVGEWTTGGTGDITIETWAAGKRNGKTTMLNKDGKKYREMSYKDDKLHGAMTIFGPDGSAQTVLQYENGKDVTK